jgi:hypothetical protein
MIYFKSILVGTVAVVSSAIIAVAVAAGLLWNVSIFGFVVSKTEIAIAVAIVLLIFTMGFLWEFRRLARSK